MSSHEEAPVQQQVISAPPPVKTVNIYVASQPIPIGTTITQDMIGIQPWPEHLVLDGFIHADGGPSIIGEVARAPFQAQEPFLSSKLANPSDPNFLAGSLPKGMRVLTIQTNEIEGIAGFIFPGDHIDVLLTHQIQKWVSPPASVGGKALAPHQEADAVTETLLTNVLVLAVDQHSTSSNAVDKNGNLIIPRSISLMVSPTDAQRLRLGAQKGTLTLALRSLQDKESADPLTITTSSDITQAGDPGAVNGGGPTSVMVVRGIEALESQSYNPPAAAETPAQTTRPGNNSSVAPTVRGAAPPPGRPRQRAPRPLQRPTRHPPRRQQFTPPPVAGPTPSLPAPPQP